MDGGENFLLSLDRAIAAIGGFLGRGDDAVVRVHHRRQHLGAAEIEADPELLFDQCLGLGLGLRFRFRHGRWEDEGLRSSQQRLGAGGK